MAEMGRPKKIVDFNMLDNLIAIFCTGEECAGVLGMDYDTLNARLKEEKGMTFSEYFKQKNAQGKASLRRKQFAMAEKHPVMAIWLGKQYLGQADKQEQKVDVDGNFKVKDIIAEHVRHILGRLDKGE